MSIETRKLINSETVYDFLEGSFFSVYTALKDDDLLDKENINFEIFRSQADFDGTIEVPFYAEDEDAQKINYGLLRFITGQVDPSQLSNVFSKSFAFEMLAFEENRDDIVKIFTSMASTINANTFNFSDANGEFVAFATVDEFPTISQTIDANGADKFIISLVFVFLFYQDAVHFNNVHLSLNGIQPEFEEITFGRQLVETVSDMRKTYQNLYIPTKSALSINISGFYISNSATDEVMRWIMDETRIEDTVRLFYTDGHQIKSGEYLISDAKLTVPFQAIVQYSISLLPYRDAVRTHRGISVKNGNGTGEYAIGDVVVISTDVENFENWEVVYSTNPSLTTESALGLQFNESSLQFTMPDADFIIRPVQSEVV